MKTLRKYEDHVQLLTALAFAAYIAWRLNGRGWEWFEWLPAAILGLFAAALFWIIVWFTVRKTTYERIAARTKRDLQSGGDGWPGRN